MREAGRILLRLTSRCRQHKTASKLYHSFYMKKRMRWKTTLAIFLAAQLAGCALVGDMNSKYIATVPQGAGLQVVDTTLDVFGSEHEIAFVFHGYDCRAPLPGHADIEVLTLDGKKLAGASFSLKELLFSGVGAITTAEEEQQRKCETLEEQEWQRIVEERQKICELSPPKGFLHKNGIGSAHQLIFPLPPGGLTVRVRARIHGFQGSGVGNMEIWSAHAVFVPPKKPKKTFVQE